VSNVQHGRAPRDGLQTLLERCVERLGWTAVRGWLLQTNTLDEVTFPPELVEEPLGGVAIAVSHFRPQGSPWSQLIVFIVATSGGVRAQLSPGVL
jgi:hypothetical protein